MLKKDDKSLITLDEMAMKLGDENAVVIDVREPEAFQNGHIIGAINHPLSQIDTFSGDMAKEYLVICQAGVRSLQAAQLLSERGYNVKSVSEGMNAWSGLTAKD